ncbi:MAG: hypothetical protein ACPG47_05020 [Leucothrix sp.]
MILRTKIAAAVSAVLFVAVGTATADVTLYDYTETASSYQDATLGGKFNTSNGNGHGQTAYNASLDLDYNRVMSSANRNLEMNFLGSGSIIRGKEVGSSSTSSYSAKGDATLENYFSPDSKGLYWYGSAEVGLEKKYDDLFTKIGAGVGYGRVVNVTPLAKAMRLIEALVDEGILAKEPNKATYLKVAQVVSREDEYKSKYRLGNYEQQWIADIEKALLASGQVQGSLGAVGTIKVHDVLINERIFLRKHGWKVNAGLGLILSNYDGTSGGDPTLDIGGEYHQPIDNKTQFSNTATLSGIFGGDNTGTRFNNEMKLTRELTDKIDWENTWVLDYNKAGDNGGKDLTKHELSSIFHYHLNNKLDLEVIAKVSDAEDGIANNANTDADDDNDDTDLSLNIGLSYRLQ